LPGSVDGQSIGGEVSLAVWQQIILIAYSVVVVLCLVRHFIWSWAMRQTAVP